MSRAAAAPERMHRRNAGVLVGVAPGLDGGRDACDRPPGGEALVADLAVVAGGQAVAAGPEMRGDRVGGGEEALGMPRRLEASGRQALR